MIELRTFGSIDITALDRPDATTVLTQPKRLALLVYLATAAPSAFIRRDILLALFWPETDQLRGRSVLRQTVYLLRQSLGADVITSRGDEDIGVDPAMLRCDVALFEAALAEGRLDDALAYYRGDFLAGFHVQDASPDLDEWIQAEARRLRTLAVDAARALATAEEAKGNPVGAANWARRALSLDSLNEQQLVLTMQLLARVGDRADALRGYREFARRADEELGIQPAHATRRLAESLRIDEERVGMSAARATTVDESPRELGRTSPSADPSTRGRDRTSLKRRALLWSAPLIVVLAVGVLLLRNTRTGATPTPSPDGRAHSLVATRLYDQGLEAYYRDDVPAAYRLFTAALAEDSSFAMAAYYAGVTALTVVPTASPELLVRAARLAVHAGDRERLFVLIRVAELSGSPTASLLADTLAARYPTDADALFALGEAAERRGDFMRAAESYRRVIAVDSLSHTTGARCLACEAYSRLWWSYVYTDSLAAAERVARECAAARPSSDLGLRLLGHVLARQGRTTEAWNAWRAADSLHTGVSLDIFGASLAIRAGEFAAADQRLRRLMVEGNRTLRNEGQWYLALSLRTQARFTEALALASPAEDGISRPIALMNMGRAREAADIFAKQASLPMGVFAGHIARHQSWVLTHLATARAAAGDTSQLSWLADTVEHAGMRSSFGRDPRLHHYIRGLLWNARGDTVRAVDEFRRSIWSWNEGYTRANYEMAQDLIARRQPAAALYPLQSALRGELEASNLYVTRTELHEALAHAFDMLGQRDSAVVHYRHVAVAWRAADPAFAARRTAALSRLDVLASR